MSDSTKCTRCGGELPANFPQGVCPTCLLQQGLSPSTFISGAGSASSASGTRRRSWTPPTPAELAPRFPQLEIIELLGQGGMGAVYKVRQKDLDRWAALKVLPDDVAHDPTFAERFQREARALALLGHQHIVIVYEFGQRDGVYFLLMEYIDGVTLRQAIRAGQISAKDALGIVAQICDALQFAHEEGVVHRDIKPENILIDKRGRVKIADFGLAKLLGGSTEVPTLTGTHQVMGTPMYMAPEQMEGTRAVDHRADIFSLGVVFYELLTGELPLGRFAPPSQKYSLDVRLDEVVLRTLEKEPDRRYQQASEVKVDVESIRSQPQPAKAKQKLPRIRSFQLWREFSRPVPTSEAKIFSWRRVAKFSAATVAFAFLIFLYGTDLLERLDMHAGKWSRFIMERRYPTDTIGQPNILLRRQRTNFNPQNHIDSVPNKPFDPVAERNEQLAAIRQSEIGSDDPNEFNAIVQFTKDGPRFNPEFGKEELNDEQRQILNQILVKMHDKYLALEKSFTKRETKDDGTQVVLIEKFDSNVTQLENELWTAIDTRFPIELQTFLRSWLPLYADDRHPLPKLNPDGSIPNMSLMGMGMMGGSTVPTGAAGMSGPPRLPASGFRGPGMAFVSYGPGQYATNYRYAQVLGWNQHALPIQITIGRKGKWYRWTIMGKFSADEFSLIDSSDAPKLPSGLRRFWVATEPDEPNQPELLTPAQASEQHSEGKTPDNNEANDEPDSMIVFTDGVPKLNPAFKTNDVNWDIYYRENEREMSTVVNRILPKVHDAFLAAELRHTHWEVRDDGTQVSVIESFEDELPKIQEPLWAEIDKRFPAPAQKLLHGMPLFADDMAQIVPSPYAANLRYLRLLGWRQITKEERALNVQDNFPMRVSITRLGNWYRWSIEKAFGIEGNGSRETKYIPGDSGFTQKLPSGIRRFWRDDASVQAAKLNSRSGQNDERESKPVNEGFTRPVRRESLDEELQDLDNTSILEKLPWNEIDRRIDALLTRFTAPEEKGILHWWASQACLKSFPQPPGNQTEIHPLALDLIRHSKESLKYERDLTKRSQMFTNLAAATNMAVIEPTNVNRLKEIHDDVIRWNLRGYAELLTLDLPDKAPDLPIVESIGDKPFGGPNGEIDPEQVSSEIRRDIQSKRRKEAEYIRELVQQRDRFITQLKSTSSLSKIGSDEKTQEKDAKEQLQRLAIEVLRDSKQVEKLLRFLWPEKAIINQS